MFFQRADNLIYIPIVDADTGATLDINDFVDVVYEVFRGRSRNPVISKSLNNGITVEENEFVIHLTDEECSFKGDTYHELVGWDARGNRSILLNAEFEFIETRVRP